VAEDVTTEKLQDFGAVFAGRGRVEFSEIGLRPLVLGTVLWVGLLVAHPIAFGVAAIHF
jgi:uncharacterized membrane protein